MHIAIDARIISSTTGRYVERLIHYLELIDKDNHYSVLVSKKDKDFYKTVNPNFKIVVADYKNYSLAEQKDFLKQLNKMKPDLVHFCMPQQPILYRGKKVTTIHDLTLLKTYNSDKNWFVYHIKQLVGWLVFFMVTRSSAVIISDSKFTANELVNKLATNPSKIKTIYLASENIKTRAGHYKLPCKKYILYVGQQSDYKNIKRLGDAHQKLLSKYPDLGLVLVGSKNESAKRNEKYFNYKKYRNILFTGFVTDEELGYLYKNSAAYVFPSLMEGFGLPGLEAMTYGAPVISSNATCLPEVYGDAAVYFDPFDTEEMAAKISKVLDDQKLREKLIANGYKQVKKYSWEKMAMETLDVYRRVLVDGK